MQKYEKVLVINVDAWPKQLEKREKMCCSGFRTSELGRSELSLLILLHSRLFGSIYWVTKYVPIISCASVSQ